MEIVIKASVYGMIYQSKSDYESLVTILLFIKNSEE